ncbi:DUF5684 domain-containing protein [uncultured Microbacterium sp.]|uniref:DUF5684 domain-containing protein n=1 Tax=uncultured Microbacterium sp. TaxID=191216 RepID=UPI0025F90DCD|nr:DUF5684 domain-containing protein [uncultured Microbacterium sp.]
MTDSTTVALGATSFALVVVLYVWFALALAAVFRKMDEPAWQAWVPVLNVATVLKRGGFSPWLVLLNIVPFFGAVAFIAVFIVAVHRINTGFGVGGGYTVVGALFPVIWASILGWGSARYAGARQSERVSEESTPVRRGRDFDGPYVPLIGGWTPEPALSSDPGAPASRPAASDAPSEPVVQPFAAPSGSLADAVPSTSDWAPPLDPRPVSFDDRQAAPPAAAAAPAPATSVFDVLDALRDGAPDEQPDRAVPDAAPPASNAPAAASADEEHRRPATPFADEEPPTRAVPVVTPTADIPTWSSPAPADEAPAANEEPEVVAPWVGPPRRTAASDPSPHAPITDIPLTRPAAEPVAAPRPEPTEQGDDFPELSEAVSAVSGAPDAGSPRSARTSVSALYTQPEVPAVSADDDFDALDRTVVTRRKRIPWALIPPSGASVDITSTVVILGRRPGPDAAHPDAQLVAISDETRTVSKTHARLELRGDTWYVTDLHSTNGVLFATLMGTEVEAPPGEEIEAGERFFLGDAEVRLSRSDA